MTTDSSSDQPAADDSAAPALFKQPQPLDSKTHRKLQLQPRQPYHFASQQMLVPVMATEMAHAAREYAVVFADAPGSLPLALLGARRSENAYLRRSGHWAARYVPAHVRRYPFVLAQHGQDDAQAPASTRRMVLIEADAPHLVFEGGMALFESDGQPSELLKRIQQGLVLLERDSERTLELVRQIEAADLLVQRVLQVAQRAAEPLSLRGLRVVDEARLAALSPAALHALQQSGALGLIHAHLLSLSNLLDGPLVEGVAAAASSQATASVSTGSIDFEGIDWGKF